MIILLILSYLIKKCSFITAIFFKTTLNETVIAHYLDYQDGGCLKDSGSIVCICKSYVQLMD